MLIIAHHNIQDPEKFWAIAQNITSALPPNFKLNSVIPSVDMKTGTCLWEGPSVMEVQKFIDDGVGDVSTNFCYEVNEGASVGLGQMLEAASSN